MVITLDIDTKSHYERTLEAIHILKTFHDVGIDVKKYAKNFDLHLAGTYGFSSSDLIILLEILAPHVLSNFTFLEGYDSTVTEQKYSIINRMEIIDTEEQKIFLSPDSDLSKFSFYHYTGDFSDVDFAAAQRAAYPFLNDYAHCMSQQELEWYKKYTKMPTSKNYVIEEDDCLESYFYTNKTRTEFVLISDLSNYCSSICRVATILANIHGQFTNIKK